MHTLVNREFLNNFIEKNCKTQNICFLFKPFESEIRIDALIERYYLTYDLKNDEFKISIYDFKKLNNAIKKTKGKHFIVTEKNYVDVVMKINKNLEACKWQ